MSEIANEIATTDGLYKAHVVTVDAPTGTSTQASDDPELDTPNDALLPPESLERLAQLSQLNGTRRACIDAIARNTVGLGYVLELDDGHETDDGDPRKIVRDARARLEACADRDTRLQRPGLTELLYAVKTDEEETGWGFVEISRNRTDGHIDGIFHLPAKRMRRLRDRTGYLLLPPSGDENDATYFADFGTKVVYEEGAPTSSLAPAHAGGWRRNEVLCWKLYSSESRDYGLPRDNALAIEYLADKFANEANAAFFDQGGTVPTALFVQGEETRSGATINVNVPAEVTQRIHSILRSRGGAGPNGTGRVAIIPLPAGVKAQKEILGSVSDRDIGFVDFRGDVRQRTLSAFRMSGVFIALGGESGGRYDAEVDRAITKEQVFDPEQRRYERSMTELILRDLGFPQLKLSFLDLAVENDAARRASADKMSERGTITRREYRRAHGWPALPEAAEGQDPRPGQVPFGWNDELLMVAPGPGTPEVAAGDDRRGLKSGSGGRGSRDRGQAASAAEAQTTRLVGVNGARGRAGARRALDRARALPED